MSARFLRICAVVALPLLGLTGCAVTPAASQPLAPPASQAPSAAPAAPSGTPTPIPTTDALPADALLEVTATATAANGAVLNLRIVVLRERLWSDPVALPRAKATDKRCGGGELDLATIKQSKFAFGEADYSATLAEGSVAWPKNLPMLLAPYGNNGASRTAAGDAYQKEYTLGGPGDYEPMCAQRAFLPGQGDGQVYLGSPDTTGAHPFHLWSREVYGFDFNLPNKKVNPASVVVSDCVGTVTPLGNTLGAPNAAWVITSSGVKCLVGDPEVQNKPHN